MNPKHKNGFTLIEILIALGLIAILISTLVFILNPAKLLSKSRNDRRTFDVNSILNAIGENISDNFGQFNCAAGDIPTATSWISSDGYDIRDCLVTEYLTELPVDPSYGIAPSAGTSTYDTRYQIIQNSTTSDITISAPDAELGATITVTR